MLPKNITKIPLWVRFLLWFRPAYYATDITSDYIVTLKSKRLFNTLYILDEQIQKRS
jgi:hypothetical protein